MDLSKLAAYELVKQENIPDIQSMGYLLRHRKSGARVLLLENEDENKVFNITFRTTPTNSTGVAHIMEHTVLCGSRKFPSKDPFVELVKGSMNTFLNAMTYSDKTMFPVASCNDRDFANLMDVYLDAVFFPNIYKKEEIFRQEGWHYQLENPEDEIVYNGVVYNEMKGALSSPDDVLEREILSSLFPDNTYFFESGGDPQFIPDLTYEEYLDFHRTYYHPSNSYIYLYGNMDFEERLDWMDKEYLSGFDVREVHSQIALQKPFDAMRTLHKTYPIGSEGEEEDQTYLSWNAVVGTSLDTKLAGAFAVLEYVLLGAPGAPLKQALLDAGIGMDIQSSYDSGIAQPVFSIIARNANGSDADRFVELIRTTLEDLAGKGLDENAIRAAINMQEFRFREADFGSFPKGLMYGIDVFDTWLYDEDHPFDYLKQLEDYDFLKAKIGTGYYEDLIRQWLLGNPHASLLVLSPERGLTTRMEHKVREKLDAYKASLSSDQIGQLVEKTRALRAFQETPSTQEELEAIPVLSREDLKKEAQPLKNTIRFADGAWIVHHAYKTNGIAYLRLMFDASGVAPEDLPYLSLLKSVIGFVDTEHYSYTDLFNEINMRTGGISVGLTTVPDQKDTDLTYLALSVSMRTLYDTIGFCFDMTREMLFTSRLDQEKRLQEILRMLVSGIGNRLAESGSTTAANRSQAGFSSSAFINEWTGNVAYFDVMKDLEKHFDEKKEEITAGLRRVLGQVLGHGRMLVSYVGDEEQIGQIRQGISGLMAMIHRDKDVTSGAGQSTGSAAEENGAAEDVSGKSEAQKEEAARSMIRPYPTGKLTGKKEGLTTPGKVQYVARCGNFVKAGFAFNGALRVLRTIMSYEYLWSNVRVVGGAYGCSANFSRNGDTSFTSYRDPQLRKTIEVFEGIPAYVENFEVSERDMTKYVIGTISTMDTPLTPAILGYRDLLAFLGHVSFEQIQKERDQVLQAGQEDIRALAPITKAVLEQDQLCVVGNEDRLASDRELFDELKELA